MNFEFKYPEFAKYPISAIVNVTDDCNLACRYCFVEKHPHYMTLETAKQIADWLYHNLEIRKQLKLPFGYCRYYFFGGEPMLCYKSIIVPIVKYCEEKYPNIFQFGITTNGTLLNKKIIDFFKEKNFSIMLSMDGIKESQDYTRPCKHNHNLSSYDLIMKNINYVVKQIDEKNLVYRGTGSGDTIQYLFENYKFAESLGFKHFAYLLNQREEWPNDKKEILRQELSKIYSYRLNQIANKITPMSDWRINFWLRNTAALLDPNSKIYDIENNNGLTRCGLGIMNVSIGYDGNLYGCQEWASKNSGENIFLIGNIKDGINIEKHTQLLKKYFDTQNNPQEHKKECKNCLLNKACKINTLFCLSSTYELFENFNEITDIECFLRQEYVSNSLLQLILFSNIDDEKENEWISTLLNTEMKGC